MIHRADLKKQLAPYSHRLDAWQAAVDAAERHIKIGATLQGQGGEILKNKPNADPESIAKLIQQATATIEKGVKLERDARDKLIELYQQQPKE